MTVLGQQTILATPFQPLGAVFGDEEMAAIFSELALVESWLAVERTLAAVQSDLGIIPRDAADAIEAAAAPERINLVHLREATRTVGYPILPLLEQVAADSPKLVADYVHWGATTQDIMDTGLALQLKRALTRIEVLAVDFGSRIAMLAEQHKITVLPARTHAQQAVPTTLGIKLAVWLDELRRHLDRLRAAEQRAVVVQLFGAAGTAAGLGPLSKDVRQRLAERLEIGAVEIPWHTARDNVAEVGFVLTAIAATCGKVAREIIELSRTEVGELRESMSAGHGASSTMPQKVNPVLSETVVAMSALARGQSAATFAAMQGTHERSAGEWQIEWDTVPALFALAAGCLKNISFVFETLEVFPAQMRSNLDREGGLLMSEAVMMALAPRIGRLHAHEVVTEACRVAREERRPLADVLEQTLDPALRTSLSPLTELVAPEAYIGEAESIVACACESWNAEYAPDTGRRARAERSS